MLDRIIRYSIHHKLIVLLFSAFIVGFGLYSLSQIPIGAVPDVTNNQVQIITTSRNLATEDVEKFLTYPVELEMANLPGVKEIRSVSKFGLSVVTVVFNDRIGTYLPRQLIAEKIKSAEEKIPAGFGKPFMGPISTGLGEIYQYVIEVDSAHRGQYSLMDLRSIQDWIVKRQLSGIPGVVEVNTWGGYLKQYEVAVNPERLRSMHISIAEVYDALRKNNSVAGGGYIEKVNQSYFIRGEGLLTGLEDIENIVVTRRSGVPVYISDLARVGYGHATRFGAITGNGEGEKVLGQVMMLKGANSKAVIDAVKKRVEEIESALPPGVYINAFLERSELIEKTTSTIAENLILGCLIVIFVVVLLLGNLRSGLVVASVIPMTLLFALSLMYIFGVDANLMSLGAIDFGIIIDGAVIIVEFIAYKITSERQKLLTLPGAERQGLIDSITQHAAGKMMHSAVFGQLIIIIVFIPILSLVGVEGKMFRPMALVFTFALLGAMLLCFTYVPVMASLFIKPSKKEGKSFSMRLISFLEDRYQPTIAWALRRKEWVLSLALLLLISVFYLFTRMGGEFVPTLDEGDFVIQPVLKTGTSLSNTVKATTQIEKILLRFPEVEQVVSRIGAAEVPTDPMSMEESDVIIKLKPGSEWVTVRSKDELADRFKEALTAEIPGVEFEFTQPIEMRFNELITGVRADLAIKIFGEDLDVLYSKALEIEKAIRNVEGAADISVEKIAGLPQMTVKYDRKKIAKYGLNVGELNQIISMGFAGLAAGTMFEGEKQFDLVLRFDQTHRNGIEDIEKASLELADGRSLPLSEFASIRYTKGPAKISREDTRRRIVVGVNVRNRDLESVVKDVQKRIAEKVALPPGYSIRYGGQFENLRTARARLMLAVPVALLLIFVLLYFAFNSVKEALMIYSAIPLSAVGGVLLLYVRGLPFSISAGVGFIALFGIAVLNGIVLIEEFKELKANGVKDIHKRILMGTRKRLRPVLLTATAAALGFLPMAVSTSAGAEVQRPLATVVIGGLISATALTLIVLPVLYAMFDRQAGQRKKWSIPPAILLLVTAGLLPLAAGAQPLISQEEAISLALKNNKGLEASALKVSESRLLKSSAFDPGKTDFYYSFDQNNISPENQPLNVWGVRQSFEFPTVYTARKKIYESRENLSEDQYRIQRIVLIKNVALAWNEAVYWKELSKKFQFLDSLYSDFASAAGKSFEEGESDYLEMATADSRKEEMEVRLKQVRERIRMAEMQMNRYLQSDTFYSVPDNAFGPLRMQAAEWENHPGIRLREHAKEWSQRKLQYEKQRLLPDLQVSLFKGVNPGSLPGSYGGVEAGVSLPLWFGPQKSRIEASKTGVMIRNAESEEYRIALRTRFETLLSRVRQYRQMLDYYENTGRNLAGQMLKHANKAYAQGEIDFLQYVQLIDHAMAIELNYLDALRKYNENILEINYLIE